MKLTWTQTKHNKHYINTFFADFGSFFQELWSIREAALAADWIAASGSLWGSFANMQLDHGFLKHFSLYVCDVVFPSLLRNPCTQLVWQYFKVCVL